MFTVNGKEYKTPVLDFNAVCAMEDAGVSLSEVGRKQFSALRAFFTLVTGDASYAGEEMQKHIMEGGTFNELSKEFGKAIEDSGFFQALKANREKEDQPGKGTKKSEA